ncbi:uncharacterized protein J8A68_005023 [[Candida] subhashii]|uniref:Partial AB-hydrolase lipase domain-containing protein n=1 Tax=[Candida] subhashii TaxID=561895 RepID=A0A8J5UU70_9ASCO|nr:uncharacterized protein J8A68_005023 [[Candida] subhashii]KAG7661445.1 hypothetical protein J8A68_005023 [[Candida] subhashii]
MNNQFKPKEKIAKHGKFKKQLIIFISALGSFWFVTVLTIGAVFYHWYHRLTGKERFNEPVDISASHGYKPRKAYDSDTKKMEATTDLRYYAQAMGLDLLEYKVTTADGYILTLHRVIDPNETDEKRDLRKPILLQHGLLCSSGGFIASGRNSLAYYLVESGYDVWMGNNRSWFEAVHSYYEGNLYNNEQYWDWSVEELAYYDLPCLIENVLSHKTGHEKLSLLGHSQGGLQSFIMLRNEEFSNIHEKIECFFPLAPAIYPGELFHTRNFIRFMYNRSSIGWLLIFGCCGFLRNLCLMRYKMASTWLFGRLSYYMFKYLFGWTARNWGKDKKVWHFCFIYNATYVSVNLMKYYLAKYVDVGFANLLLPKKAYKTGENFVVNSKYQIDDSNSFFPFKESWFNNNKVTVPMVVFIGEKDDMVDGRRLVTHMKHFEPKYKEGENIEYIEIPTYNHVDVIWAEDLIGHIGFAITKKLKSMEEVATGEPKDIPLDEKVVPESPERSSVSPFEDANATKVEVDLSSSPQTEVIHPSQPEIMVQA